MQPSEQVCLLHDSDKLFLADLSISVSVSLIDHFLQFFVSHCLPQLSCHSFQVLQWNLSCIVVIKQSECLQNLLPWVPFADLCSHQLHEVRKLNHSLSVSVNFCDQFLYFLLFGLKAKSSHGDLEFFWVNVSWGWENEVPTDSVSKRSKASLIYCFCSSVSSFLAFLVGLSGAFYFLKVVDIWIFCI